LMAVTGFPADDLILDRTVECRAERIASISASSHRKYLMTTFAGNATTTLVFQASSLFAPMLAGIGPLKC
jgi:hypothetical protein